MFKIEQILNLSGGKLVKLVKHHQLISNPFIEHLQVCVFLNPSSRPKDQICCNGLVKIWFFQAFSRENVHLSKKTVFFLPWSIYIFFWLLKAKYQTQIVERPKFKQHPYKAKAFRIPEHISKQVERQKTRFFERVKVVKFKSA